MSENKTYRLADNEALAQARHVRMTPLKTRRIVNLVRGRKADDALTMLRFAPQTAAEVVFKVIASAMANAEHNHQLNPQNLWISQAYVDEGTTLKRFRPRAQGRAYRINKRTSHITIVVQEREVTPLPTRRAKASAKPAGKSDSVKAGAAKDAPAKDAKKPSSTSGTKKSDRAKGSTVTSETSAPKADASAKEVTK